MILVAWVKLAASSTTVSKRSDYAFGNVMISKERTEESTVELKFVMDGTESCD